MKIQVIRLLGQWFLWANEADKKQVFGIKVPYMLSILSYGKPSGTVPNEYR